MMSRWNLLVVIAIVAGAAGQPAVAGEILFSAAPGSIVEDIRDTGEPVLIPRATTQVRLKGVLFDAPITITPAIDGGRDTVVAALAADFADNLSTDPARFVGGYAAAERAGFDRSLNDGALKSNAAFFRTIVEMRYLGYATHEDHVIVLVDYRFAGGKRKSLAFAVVKEDERYVRSNGLSGDRTYGVVFAAVWNGDYQPVPRQFSAYGEPAAEAATR